MLLLLAYNVTPRMKAVNNDYSTSVVAILVIEANLQDLNYGTENGDFLSILDIASPALLPFPFLLWGLSRMFPLAIGSLIFSSAKQR